MRDDLNEALRHLDRVALFAQRGTEIREHVDLARSQIVSALLSVLKQEQAVLREYLAEKETEEP
jgi:hypothetical protein